MTFESDLTLEALKLVIGLRGSQHDITKFNPFDITARNKQIFVWIFIFD